MIRAAAFCLVFVANTFAAAADDPLAAAAQKVMSEQSSNVVTVRIAARLKMSGGDGGSMDMDMVIEATGFLLDPAGLVVSSLNATDPQRLYDQYFAEMAEDEADKVNLATEVSKVSVLLEGNKEIEAEAGLRDSDLDLAYFVLKEKATVGTAAKGDAATPAAFDTITVLRRLGNVADRICAGTLLRVQAVAERPRKFYVIANDETVGLGEPVFDLDGKCVGLITLRTIKNSASETYYLFSGEDPNNAVIVLPLVDVLEGARQHEKFGDLGK